MATRVWVSCNNNENVTTYPKQNFSCIYMFSFNFSVPTSWKRKTDPGVPLNILERASNDVKEQGKSIRSVAKQYGICHVTLYRFCKERKKLEEKGSRDLPRVGYHSGKKVFTDEQENELTAYLMRAADAYYGLCPCEVSGQELVKDKSGESQQFILVAM